MKTKMPYEEALARAQELMVDLRPGCERIEIAGSLRRRKAEIGDIELVAIPRMIDTIIDLWGQPVGRESQLEQVISEKYHVIRGDKKYKKIDLKEIECDLFIQPDPATWGVNMMIRTGCAEFSHWMVTERRKGGAMPSYLRFHDARIWQQVHGTVYGIEPLDTPEEEDVFRVLGIRWIPPEERTQGFFGQLCKFLIREGGK